MIRSVVNGTEVMVCESVVDTLAAAMNPDPQRHLGNAYGGRYWEAPADGGFLGDPFTRDASSANVARVIREGWHDGAARLLASVGAVDVAPARSLRRRATWGDMGDEVDLQRVYAGRLETAWRRMSRVEAVGPRRVRIVVDLSVSGVTDASYLFWKGAAACRLADLLTEAGYAVQVWSANATALGYLGRGGGTDFCISTCVKDYSSPLDLGALAATTAMPAWFRKVVFSIGYGHVRNHQVGGGFGRVTSLAAHGRDRLALPEDASAATVTVFGRPEYHPEDATEGVWDAATATAWVREQVALLEGAGEGAA